jgi:hypothetical protein
MAFNEDSKLKDISSNEQAKAIIEKYIPGIWENPQTKMAMSFTLKAMARFPQAGISLEKLQEIASELSKVE